MLRILIGWHKLCQVEARLDPRVEGRLYAIDSENDEEDSTGVFDTVQLTILSRGAYVA